MESLAAHEDIGEPTKAKEEPGRIQRLVRTAILGMPFLFYGGDTPHSARVSPIEAMQQEVVSSSFSTLKQAHQTLTPEEYIVWLAGRLKDQKELARFLQSNMRYEDDIEGNAQPPHETVMTATKTIDGKMTGDCEDYAILSQRLLAEMGILSQVVYMNMIKGGHAVCLWVEKNHHGKYQAYCLDNGILAKDDNFTRGIGQPPNAPEGYNSIRDALDAVIANYRDRSGHQCRMNPWSIRVFRETGGHYLATTTTILAFDPELPAIARFHHIDLVVFGAVLLAALATYDRTRKWHVKDAKTPDEDEQRMRFFRCLKEYLTTFRLY